MNCTTKALDRYENLNGLFFTFLVLIIILAGCKTGDEKGQKVTPSLYVDPLPSWNEGTSKESIIAFVTKITDSSGNDFIPPEDRIATFDNDGTLWCEQPMYFEFLYSMAATKIIATNSPELSGKPAIKALVDGDIKKFMASGETGFMQSLLISHAATSVDEFNKMASDWLDTARHERFGRKYTELTYKPMVELLSYLRDNQFKTYIVSGGSSQFIRVFSENAYGIPPEQVVGTMLKARYGNKTISRGEEIWLDNDKAWKPVGIYQIIGRKPVLAFGNSDGDYQMLEWTSTNTLPHLSLILHHTDAEREYAYDRNSDIGRLDKGLTDAPGSGWIVVDMKKDFKQVFFGE